MRLKILWQALRQAFKDSPISACLASMRSMIKQGGQQLDSERKRKLLWKQLEPWITCVSATLRHIHGSIPSSFPIRRSAPSPTLLQEDRVSMMSQLPVCLLMCCFQWYLLSTYLEVLTRGQSLGLSGLVHLTPQSIACGGYMEEAGLCKKLQSAKAFGRAFRTVNPVLPV